MLCKSEVSKTIYIFNYRWHQKMTQVQALLSALSIMFISVLINEMIYYNFLAAVYCFTGLSKSSVYKLSNN